MTQPLVSSLAIQLNQYECPCRESDLDWRFRKPQFYPLNYRDVDAILNQVALEVLYSNPSTSLGSIGLPVDIVVGAEISKNYSVFEVLIRDTDATSNRDTPSISIG